MKFFFFSHIHVVVILMPCTNYIAKYQFVLSVMFVTMNKDPWAPAVGNKLQSRAHLLLLVYFRRVVGGVFLLPHGELFWACLLYKSFCGCLCRDHQFHLFSSNISFSGWMAVPTATVLPG